MAKGTKTTIIDTTQGGQTRRVVIHKTEDEQHFMTDIWR